MTRFTKLALLPVVLAFILIPQILFFWLVPSFADSKMIVYYFGTAHTVFSPIIAFAVYCIFGLRKSIGLIVCVGILETITIFSSAFLFAFNVDSNTAIFPMVLLSLLYLICLLPMLLTIINSKCPPVEPINIGSNCYDNHKPECQQETPPNLPKKKIKHNLDSVTPLPPKRQ